jgi:hypothetical protein
MRAMVTVLSKHGGGVDGTHRIFQKRYRLRFTNFFPFGAMLAPTPRYPENPMR